MRVKNFLFVFIIMIISLTTTVNAETPEITGTAGIVMDCIDGKILYEKNSSEKLYPASMTKVLTAILVIENCNMQDEVVISKSAIDNVQIGYLTANIKEGEILTIEQLLNLLLISSYNDVANALAEHIGGNVENFATMMNEKAKELGCKNSNFVNSNGAHDVNHYSTAYDMALIGRYAMQYDEIKEIVGKIYYELGTTNKYDKNDRLYQTTNEMLLSGSSNYYSYVQGIKTGFTTPAGYCLMSYAEKNDMPLVTVVIKSTTSDSRYEDTKKILEYAYGNNTIKTIAEKGRNLQTITIKNATSKTKKLNAVLEETIKAVVKKETVIKSYEPHIELQSNLKAPIKAGTVIGKVTYKIEGKEYSQNLVAENNINKSYTLLIFVLIFIGLILLFGTLRVLALYNRNKTLKNIRENIYK